MSALVVVLLGTDHHPFQRMVDWADEVARLRPDLHLLVQHGTTSSPRVAEGRAFLPHAELMDLVRRAAAVACHGGPGTIMDARSAGHRPVCVPRDPALGEHVDGHQLRFAQLVARSGAVRTVDRVDQFHAALHQAVTSTGRPGHALATSDPTVEAARARLGRELDRLAGALPVGPAGAAPA